MKNRGKSARENLPKSALARLYFIDEQIASGKYPNTKALIDSWEGSSASTIGRDIAFMKDRLNAPIEYDAAHRGYYYSKPNYRIPMGFSGSDELLALAMAKNILTLYKNTPIHDAANQLLESITAPLSAEGNSDWFKNRIVVPQVPSMPVSHDVWELITKALKENRILTFDYKGAYNPDYRSRRIRPYQLLFDNGIWYLYGFAEERKNMRIFSLGRIKNIALTKDKFALPADFDYRAHSTGYFGVFSGQKKQRYKIAFYDYSVPWLKDRKWAEDQKITETDDGVVITFTSSQTEKIMEWVLSRGCTALPLEPESFVTSWRWNIDEMQKMAKLNESKQPASKRK
jgi:predicted DNA-binding transcriptional regulator YafY